jgi:hypothetical protein
MSLKNNWSIEMKIIEKILFVSFAGLVIAVAVMAFKSGDSSTIQTEEPKTDLITIRIELPNGYNMTESLGVRDRPISISKNNPMGGYTSLRILHYLSPYEDFLEEMAIDTDEILQGPNGWQYYEDDLWDPTIGSKVPGNISRIFFRNVDGRVLLIEQYDYTGGANDEEIFEWLEGISPLELLGGKP